MLDSQTKYCLMRPFGYWYLVPLDRKQEFERWVATGQGVVPNYTIYLPGPLENYAFTGFELADGKK